ncbi:TIGR03086 family metal-binding protein [Streptomyces tubbatahanensis]|uniref:TIGR03086 family metal-binding protein n=1 Tax=Streptomyces tubbatahanensis TaxID=2923272 RepID=A0ABY3XSM8_9ACTN|nr:TIGR03086 family metal-binding protein [Streptomyces tubbatahanensis]UNS97400.1 TIGR03086 family metal-binding protein [Streptomyces tubbatahanensis]
MFRQEEDEGSGTEDGRRGDTAEQAAELLRRAVGYALGAAQCVTPALLGRPTPCAAWDLGALLSHVDDSLAALHEGITEGAVALHPHDHEPGSAALAAPDQDPAAAFRRRAARLLGASAGARPGVRIVAVADAPLTATALALTGAVELAVHGWDIAWSTGHPERAVPVPLAARLLPVARHLVPHDGARHPLFGPRLPLPDDAPPTDRLLAFLGRAPHARAPAPVPGRG